MCLEETENNQVLSPVYSGKILNLALPVFLLL